MSRGESFNKEETTDVSTTANMRYCANMGLEGGLSKCDIRCQGSVPGKDLYFFMCVGSRDMTQSRCRGESFNKAETTDVSTTANMRYCAKLRTGSILRPRTKRKRRH
ncbi:hypothetical protein CEXT_775341 [Caerostris extrusa]|uniref:Uncharacterized protein n=1 Tax=Caerostris extrusa TaxID=172846 RepID=A0AAV4MKY0_CAEEX|nr:hypothetical protein CEXT_775341 [Caerostris extrusa]